ncbi:putative autophagy protein [Kockovaella imperatae]|uniref:Autophagy-related protein n=1 Tax=Kockovaella imperatae TaxID=4999 RepID=A0A1Y1UIY0_9TREE|nr:putative autophagy protein [Kockovaella imperatae]ORX37517.1 putative autophagy protein [Kockovaella imperatae]
MAAQTETSNAEAQHVLTSGVDEKGEVLNAHNTVGLAVMEQQELIPITGERKVTTQWEYWTYCAFYFSPNGGAISSNGQSMMQLLISLQFPDNIIPWGGRLTNMNSLVSPTPKLDTQRNKVLDFTGIIFAIQLALLLIIGPYADYGNWRPYILMVCQLVLVVLGFAFIGVKSPSQWVAAEALYIITTVANNIVNAFYMAAFPGIVQDLPKIRQSEREVLAGTKSPEDHELLDSYERSKLNNLLNVVGSSVEVVAFCVAVGIAAGVGYATNAEIIRSYQILLGFFGAFTIIATVPYFIAQKHRPGQQLPDGANWLTVGFVQIWAAIKGLKYLKQCMLYMFAYFMIQETYGTYSSITGILQNEVMSFSPVMLNALSVIGNLLGGGGNLFMYLLQKRFRFATKPGLFYGACMTLVPNLFGAIGTFTNVIGFHHKWAFWLAQAWNFQMAGWNAYQVAFLSEVVPAPKAYLFFALFNTVGKTSSFVGPFVSSAISAKTNGNTSAAYWFTLAMGTTGTAILWFVDPKKAKLDCVKFLEAEAADLYNKDTVPAPETVVVESEDHKDVVA